MLSCIFISCCGYRAIQLLFLVNFVSSNLAKFLSNFNNLSKGLLIYLYVFLQSGDQTTTAATVSVVAFGTTASHRNWSPVECGVLPWEHLLFQQKASSPLSFPGPMDMHLVVEDIHSHRFNFQVWAHQTEEGL